MLVGREYLNNDVIIEASIGSPQYIGVLKCFSSIEMLLIDCDRNAYSSFTIIFQIFVGTAITM